MSENSASWSLEGKRVETIAVADKVPTMDVGFAWHNIKEHSEAAEAFIEFMHLGMGAGQPHIACRKTRCNITH